MNTLSFLGHAPGGKIAFTPVTRFSKAAVALLSTLFLAVFLLAGTNVYSYATGQQSTFTSNSNGTWNVTSPNGVVTNNVSLAEASSDYNDWADAGGGVVAVNGIPVGQEQT